MIPLRKTVIRETTRARDAGRNIIVSLEPGDVIGFRLKGCRQTFRMPLQACYSVAVKLELKALREAKKVRRKLWS
jgi:hypothetical protein